MADRSFRLAGRVAPDHPQLAAITGHEHVAPGRKTDPGPMFDWLRLARATVLPCVLPSFS